MTHPEDLLADLVGGSLPEADRAALTTHLASCSRCTAEVAAATAARSALVAVPDEAAPASIAEMVSRTSPARRPGHDRSAPAWQRWLGPAAAVAAAALVLALVLPKLGGDSSTTSASSSDATTEHAPSAPAGVLLELETADYTAEELNALTTRSAQQISSDGAAGTSPASIAAAPTKLAGEGRTQAATACIQQAFQQVPGSLIRLIRARFEGTPAYIGLYTEGPGGGQPADALTLRVASTADCVPLSIAQVPL